MVLDMRGLPQALLLWEAWTVCAVQCIKQSCSKGLSCPGSRASIEKHGRLSQNVIWFGFVLPKSVVISSSFLLLMYILS